MAAPEGMFPKKKPSLNRYGSGNETVLHDETSRRVHVLNSTAALIWEYCDGQTGIDEILESMAGKFPDVDREKLRQDIENTLERLRTGGLLLG